VYLLSQFYFLYDFHYSCITCLKNVGDQLQAAVRFTSERNPLKAASTKLSGPSIGGIAGEKILLQLRTEHLVVQEDHLLSFIKEIHIILLCVTFNCYISA
jgi:hypothetical protein